MWSRSRRLGLETVSRPIEGLVSVLSRACRQTSRSRPETELRSRSWPRSRQFRSVFLSCKDSMEFDKTLQNTPLKNINVFGIFQNQGLFIVYLFFFILV